MYRYKCTDCGKIILLKIKIAYPVCPLCNGDLLSDDDRVTLMTKVDWQNKKLINGNRSGYNDTYFMYHCLDVWQEYIDRHGVN